MDKIKIKPGKVSDRGVEVSESDQVTPVKVREYEFRSIKQNEGRTYSNVKSKYGSFADTDQERSQRNQKDSHFKMNSVLKESLSIYEEEQRVIQEKVQLEVERIRAEAQSKAEAEGYQIGLKRGIQEAGQKLRAEQQGNLAKFMELIESFENTKTDLLKANERFLIEMVFRVSRMVLLKDLSTDRDYILRLVRELVQRVGSRENITLKVNRKDFETIQSLKGDLDQIVGGMKNLQVEVSPLVRQGGCFFETQWNTIDATIETQLASLLASLTGKPQGET